MKVNSSSNPTDPKKKIIKKSKEQKVQEALDANPDYVFEGPALEEAVVTPTYPVYYNPPAPVKEEPEFPYYSQLNEEQKKLFNDDSPIGRSIRSFARSGERITSEDAKALAQGFILNPLSYLAQIPATPMAATSEAIAQFKREPYNYSSSIPSLFGKNTQRFPSQVLDKEIGYANMLWKATGLPAPSKEVMGLAVDIASDPLTWGPFALSKMSKGKNMFEIGATMMSESSKARELAQATESVSTQINPVKSLPFKSATISESKIVNINNSDLKVDLLTDDAAYVKILDKETGADVATVLVEYPDLPFIDAKNLEKGLVSEISDETKAIILTKLKQGPNAIIHDPNFNFDEYAIDTSIPGSKKINLAVNDARDLGFDAPEYGDPTDWEPFHFEDPLESGTITQANTNLYISYDDLEETLGFTIFDKKGNELGTVGDVPKNIVSPYDLEKIKKHPGEYGLGDLSKKTWNSLYEEMKLAFEEGTVFKSSGTANLENVDVHAIPPGTFNKSGELTKVSVNKGNQNWTLHNSHNEATFNTNHWDDEYLMPASEGDITPTNVELHVSEGTTENNINIKVVDPETGYILGESKKVPSSKYFHGLKDFNNGIITFANSVVYGKQFGKPKKQASDAFVSLFDVVVSDTEYINKAPDWAQYITKGPHVSSESAVFYNDEKFSLKLPDVGHGNAIDLSKDLTKAKQNPKESIVNLYDSAFGRESGTAEVYTFYREAGISEQRVTDFSNVLSGRYVASSNAFNSSKSSYLSWVNDKGKTFQKAINEDFVSIIQSQQKTTGPTKLYRGSGKSNAIFRIDSQGNVTSEYPSNGPGDSIILHEPDGSRKKISAITLTKDDIGKTIEFPTHISTSISPTVAYGFTGVKAEHTLHDLKSWPAYFDLVEPLNKSGMPVKSKMITAPSALFSIDVPANQSIFLPTEHTLAASFSSEVEVLLQQGTKLRLKEVYGASDIESLTKMAQPNAEGYSAQMKLQSEVDKVYKNILSDYVSRVDKTLNDTLFRQRLGKKLQEGKVMPSWIDMEDEEKIEKIMRGAQSAKVQMEQGRSGPMSIYVLEIVDPKALLPLFFIKKMFGDDATPSKGQEGN